MEVILILYLFFYYVKMVLEYVYFEFVKIKNGKWLEVYIYYVLLSVYKSFSYLVVGIGIIIRMFNKNKMFVVGNSYLYRNLCYFFMIYICICVYVGFLLLIFLLKL